MRTRPCLPPTHYRHWPITLGGPYTNTHTGCIIAEKHVLWGSLSSLLFSFKKKKAHKTVPLSTSYTQQTNNQSASAYPCSLKFVFSAIFFSKQKKIETHQEYTPKQKELVNNWSCQSATVLSEGTACKHHRRKVKVPLSNYLSPKAIAVETKCYWRVPTWWTILQETLMRCYRQIQYYLSDCIFWWRRSWYT